MQVPTILLHIQLRCCPPHPPEPKAQKSRNATSQLLQSSCTSLQGQELTAGHEAGGQICPLDPIMTPALEADT